MAHPDPAVSDRDRAVEAMALSWTDLSHRYDRPPVGPHKKCRDIEQLKPNDEDEHQLAGLKQLRRVDAGPDRDWPTLF